MNILNTCRVTGFFCTAFAALAMLSAEVEAQSTAQGREFARERRDVRQKAHKNSLMSQTERAALNLAMARGTKKSLAAGEGKVLARPLRSGAPLVQSAARAFSISGYLQPTFSFRRRAQAFPRDKNEYGFSGTRTGVVLQGEPLSGWRYQFHFVVGAGIVNALTNIKTIDSDGDGESDALAVDRERRTGITIERAVVIYQASSALSFELGQMRIPYTVQNLRPNFALLLADRANSAELFILGTDLGGMAHYRVPWGRLSVGLYNGTGANNAISAERGLLYAARGDFHPLGPVSSRPHERRNTSTRFDVGFGILYFPTDRFAASGFEGIRVRDLRASGSLSLASGGLYLQVEILRRQQTDSLSHRPIVASGGYGQGSYYVPLSEKFGLSPVGRLGITVEDESFDPRSTVFSELGIAAYFHRSRRAEDTIKLVVQYQGEQRLTQNENAFGGAVQLQLRW